MNKYLNGTILEMLERVKTLKTKIPVNTLPLEFSQLVVTANNELDKIITNLERLHIPTNETSTKALQYQLTALQNTVLEIDHIENFVIASLNRWSPEDKTLLEIISKICKEIRYPLLPPVVSRLSQNYYSFSPKFNLLAVPLLESEFLLHIPDLYHELAHQLIMTKNHPGVTSFQTSLGSFNSFVLNYFDQQIAEYQKNNGREFVRQLDVFRASWIEAWSTEMFCDLFAAYTSGPAFAWAHLHLCVKRANNPFETPEYYVSSHPADDARMQAILFGLEHIGFKNDVKMVREHWQMYVDVSGGTIESKFKMAFPKHILEHCSMLALEGTKAIKCQIATRESTSEIYSTLNLAWQKFINDPSDYISWEKTQREL